VTNFGPSGASSVVVTDMLPLGVTFVSASGGGANTSGVVSWSLGTLANGQVSNVTVTVTAPASGSLTNVAAV
jgi:expansin (peptidoglycan-binding protein)